MSPQPLPSTIQNIKNQSEHNQDSSSENDDEYTRVLIRQEIDQKLKEFNFEEIFLNYNSQNIQDVSNLPSGDFS